MSLSSRFSKIPAPRYDGMQLQQNGGSHHIKRAHPKNNHRRKPNNHIYDEAIIHAEPQIIRPNVANVNFNPSAPRKQFNNKKANNFRNNNNNGTFNPRNRNQHNNNNPNHRFHSNPQNNRTQQTTNNPNRNPNANPPRNNRTRPPFRATNNHFTTNSFQTVQHGPNTAAPNTAYKSYRTSNLPNRVPMDYRPYKQPFQNTQQPVRQLPPYQSHTNNVYNRSGANRNPIRNQNNVNRNALKYNNNTNGYHRNNNNSSYTNNSTGHSNGYHNNSRNQNSIGYNNEKIRNNSAQKRQNYYNQRNNNMQPTQNGNVRNNYNKTNPKFNNKRSNGNVSGTTKPNPNNNQRQRNGNVQLKSFRKTDAAALDRELDAYIMKNPNVEDRNNAVSANLDKELDDYFSSQKDEANDASSKKDE